MSAVDPKLLSIARSSRTSTAHTAGVVAAVVGAALVGCSLAPPLKTPQVPLAASYQEMGPWTLASPSDQLPREQWWALYNDGELNDLQQRLIQNSPDLATALARYREAQAYATQVRSGLFPNVQGQASVERSRDSAMTPLMNLTAPKYFDTDIVGVQAAYELDFWGQVRNQVAAGNAQAAAAAANLESARLSLQAQLADNYIVLRGLDHQTALLTQTIEGYSQALDLTRQRFNSGITSGLDVAQAQNQFDSARSQLSQIQAQRATVEHAIAALIGSSPSQFKLEPRDTEIQLPRVPAGVPAALLQRRPDVAAAQRQMQAANANIGVARAAYFPSVNLSASAGYETYDHTSWITAPNLFWAVGPSLLLDVFDAGKRKAQVAQARASLDEAAAQYRGVALGAFQQVEDNLALLEHYHSADEAQQSAVNAAQQALDYSLTRYRAGAINYLDVVVSQTAALQARMQALDISTLQLRASVQLIRALGGGWQNGEARIARAR